MKKLLLIMLLTIAHTAYAQVGTQGNVDCARWAKARKTDQAIALEHYLIGTVNGLAMGAWMEIWSTSNGLVSQDQLFLWMDGWCLKNPLKSTLAGAIAFANERTNGAFNNRQLPK